VLGGGALALRLSTTAATDTLVPRSSSSFKATESYHQAFGDDAVIVLVRGSLRQLVLTSDVERVLGLEGCLSGNLPANVVPRGGRNGPCAQIARARATRVVYGPGTFINESVGQISDQFAAQSGALAGQERTAAQATYQLARGRGMSAARARALAAQAAQLVQAEFVRSTLQLAVQYGLRAPPQLNNPDFVSTLVFDPTKALGTPKARFAYLFPTSNSALIQVRLRPDLPDATRRHAIALIRRAVAMPDWRLQHGGRYFVTGVPVIVSDLTSAITHSIIVLLIAALLVMAAVLALVFRQRLRLLPLAIAVGAAALTFGALALSGASLTMASIGVLPVLIGLAVDYAIQLQSRHEEIRLAARAAAGGAEPEPEQVIARAAMVGAPTIATAGLATAGGFLVLALPVIGSPVPMVRDFGILLVIGVVLAFAVALTAGSAALAIAGRPQATAAAHPLLARWWRATARAIAAGVRAIGPAVVGAFELVTENRFLRAAAAPVKRAALAASARVRAIAAASFELATGRPLRVLGVGVALALVGWVVGTQTRVESNIQKLVPQSLPALRNLDALQRSTNVGGEIDVTVAAADLTQPAVLSWMTSYQQRVLRQFGYSPARGCGKARLCPAFSLTDLLGTQGTPGAQPPSQSDVRGLLAAVPTYFSQGVITPDHKIATLAFGIRLMPLDQQKQVVDAMRAALNPPPGVTAQLAGLPVLAADANAAVASPWRRLLTLLGGLVAVGLVLLLAFREPRRALLPLVPITLASGWSALVLFAIRVPLNPMSVTLGALVIAISTEFSVLLAERYRQERQAGHEPREALARTYRFMGAAVLASGVTAIAGFAVLVTSSISMLRDFGFVTVVDLTVALLGVMVVLPAVLLLAERERAPGWLGRALRTVVRRGPRPRRATVA
jgi:hydrophobe/amphiphile efflux-3 (HAE3) family protein